MKSTYILLGLLLIGLVFVSGCTSSSEQAPSKSPESNATQPSSTTVGNNVAVSFRGTLENSITSSGDYPYTTDSDSGKIFLKVTMNIKNNGYETFSTNPLYFHVTINNIKYDYDSTTFELTDKLDMVDVLDKGTLSGSLLFQIPQSASNMPFTMNYDGYCDGFNTCNVVWSKA